MGSVFKMKSVLSSVATGVTECFGLQSEPEVNGLRINNEVVPWKRVAEF